ncbi:cysteine peptidase family C39 domain-containing protein [Pseudanabaena yagii]|uniref:Peptidase C39 n=1 Tax=Pseudanabaena yagii GIHE-NHR1 TaxID=2722753 RepID=A0ABX1LXH9_9CYAN|nr:cysteine peptidase family C39 domain-containing protein [Pseudanabaena yagii]NMF58572.1 peptidase C39 [Pseudanabaena yagii GIHE-NHR1]
MVLPIAICISFLVGAYFGRYFAQKGLTANNALQQHQKQVYLLSCITLGIITLIAILMTSGRNIPWVPAFISLYLGAYAWQGILLICIFCMGLMLLLEIPAWKDRQRLQQLILFLVISISSVLLLIYQNLPITDLIESPRILKGIVLQTTPYSCAAATIATLSRQFNPALDTTELDVVKLAGTSRQGTNILSEIQAMEKLGLAPQYERNLTIADLVKRRQMAVLHVMEPVSGTRIQHAIALLAIDPVKEKITVANPLYGIQDKKFIDMKDYWLEDAIFVTASQK